MLDCRELTSDFQKCSVPQPRSRSYSVVAANREALSVYLNKNTIQKTLLKVFCCMHVSVYNCMTECRLSFLPLDSLVCELFAPLANNPYLKAIQINVRLQAKPGAVRISVSRRFVQRLVGRCTTPGFRAYPTMWR